MVAVAAAMSSGIPPRGGKMSMAACSDYGRPVSFFVQHIPNFWLLGVNSRIVL